MDLLKTTLYASIDDLLLKYKDDEYIKQKLENYICNQLPNILNNLKANQIERKNRIEEMTNEKEQFIQQFLHNNQYFFMSNTNTFFMYDGLHYQIFSEDDILHHVLSSISKDRYLMSWKHKTKVNIMKKIKDNSLLTTIPESETIQFVLTYLVGNIFPNKETAKYFLCIVGDSLLKKNSHLIHYVSNNGKNTSPGKIQTPRENFGKKYKSQKKSNTQHQHHKPQNTKILGEKFREQNKRIPNSPSPQ
jgi:hypothetical protein